ncbi:MAG: exopolysaccharide biosynthesis protein [Leptolyngbyaceae bacterium]|nr:exopolysaccharide biosynthesis protein [Leptolyngbyaceae bacterium]
MARFSVELHDFFFSEERSDRITLLDILELAGERTFGFLLVLLSLPSALPIPAPGYSIPFGIVLFLLALQLILGRVEPWFPQWFRNRSIALSQAQAIIKAATPWLKRLESFSRPRMTYLCTSRAGRVILGCAIALMGISMMIPLPLTNTLPAIGVFVIGFSLIEDDGFISIVGLTISVLAASLSTALITAYIIGGTTLVDAVIDRIRDLKP